MKINSLFQVLYPSLIWEIETSEKIIYLTFDDGPIPVVTEWVLGVLREYDALATFFCIGDNVRKHPDVFKKVIDAGHALGNHTMNHLNGWKTDTKQYLQNVRECEKYVSSDLFRPPYGRIKRNQIKLLQDKKIVMWDVLSKDYDQGLSGEDCFKRVQSQTHNGSIVVFHDSIKSGNRLRIALPKTLEYFSKNGFRFERLAIDEL